jgi:hypothetical protein
MEVSMFAPRFQKTAGISAPASIARPSRLSRRLALLALTGVFPLAAAFSQGTVVAHAAIPNVVTGTWAMLQVSKTSALTFYRPSIDAALAIPGVTGFSLRAPWTAITSNLSIFDDGVQIAQADHAALAIRFVSGVDTPPQYMGNSTKIGTQSIPLPWGPGSTPTSFVPNSVFEDGYRSTVVQLAAYARTNGIHLLHLPWYSGTTAEIYDGAEVQNAPGYSLQNFLTGYERLVAIGMSVAGPDLTVEFPLGGVGTGPLVGPLETYMSTTFGSDNPELLVQFNDLTDALPGPQHPAAGVNMGRQMMGDGDFNWVNVYQQLASQDSQSVEIYLQSFAPSLAHAAALRQQVAAFANQAASIAAMTPSAGPAGGGQTVHVSGSGFAPGMSVTIGGAAVTPTGVTSASFSFTTPAGSPGSAQVQVTTANGPSTETAASTYTYEPLANYVPLTPFRILDTRSLSCIACTGGALTSGATRHLALVGVTGLRSGADPIPSDATAVMLNVTAVDSTTGGLLSLYPAGTAQPRASNLNFVAHSATPNLVAVTLGTGGAVNIFNAIGSVNVIADVEGYFAPQPSSDVQGEFHPIAPVRVCDTRVGTPLNTCTGRGAVIGGRPVVINVTGLPGNIAQHCGSSCPASIPADGSAAAAVLNLTGVAGTAATYLSVFPTQTNGGCAYSGSHPPAISTLNLNARTVAANRVIVGLGPATTGGPDTSVCVYSAVGTINVILDAGGWFGAAGAAPGFQYQAIGPSRICDTRVRSGLPCAGRALGSGAAELVSVAGIGGVPGTDGNATPVQAVMANLTAIAPTDATYLSLYPANVTSRPLASDLNPSAGATVPNLAVVEVDSLAGADDGDLEMYNGAGSVNVVIDIEGWFQ